MVCMHLAKSCVILSIKINPWTRKDNRWDDTIFYGYLVAMLCGAMPGILRCQRVTKSYTPKTRTGYGLWVMDYVYATVTTREAHHHHCIVFFCGKLTAVAANFNFQRHNWPSNYSFKMYQHTRSAWALKIIAFM